MDLPLIHFQNARWLLCKTAKFCFDIITCENIHVKNIVSDIEMSDIFLYVHTYENSVITLYVLVN